MTRQQTRHTERKTKDDDIKRKEKLNEKKKIERHNAKANNINSEEKPKSARKIPSLREDGYATREGPPRKHVWEEKTTQNKTKNYSFTSREVNEAMRLNTCSRPCAFEEKKTEKKNHGIPPHPKHITKFTAARRDRDHVETACDETRSTR